MGLPATPIISFITVLLVILPLSYQLKTKNIAITCLALWIAQWNLFQGINSILWNGSVVRKWLVYCDISESFLCHTFNPICEPLQTKRQKFIIRPPTHAIFVEKEKNVNPFIRSAIALFLKNAGVFGAIASNMCILRHLEHISSPSYMGADQGYTKSRTRFEVLMCMVLPFVFAGCRK